MARRLPFQGEEAREFGRRGGLSTSPAKSAAAKKRELQKRSPAFAAVMSYFNTDNPQEALAYFEEKICSLELNIANDKAAGKDTFVKELRLLDLMLKVHTARFGDVHKNVNSNIELSRQEAEKRLYEFIKAQEASTREQ